MLFDKVIFGPIRSRRLGLSLGVNLLPPTSKVCNFNCIYCECGWNTHDRKPPLNSREEVAEALRAKLCEMAAEGECPDVITFAGNGEPTIHPDFEAIIDDTLALRDELSPSARVSVLSNATMLHRQSVCRALAKVDNNILKLDSAFDATARLMNGPLRAACFGVLQRVHGNPYRLASLSRALCLRPCLQTWQRYCRKPL